MTEFPSFDSVFNLGTSKDPSTNYPPYNLYQDGEKTIIELALAGWDKNDLEVTIYSPPSFYYASYRKVLTVKGTRQNKTDHEKLVFARRGIAMRSFKREFILGDNTDIETVSFENGLLTIICAAKQPDPKQDKIYLPIN